MGVPDWFPAVSPGAKRVQSEADAAAELAHFQNAYPSDPRSFFPRQAQVPSSPCTPPLRDVLMAVSHFLPRARSCRHACIHSKARWQTKLATEVLRRFKEEYPSPDLFRPITKARPHTTTTTRPCFLSCNLSPPSP